MRCDNRFLWFVIDVKYLFSRENDDILQLGQRFDRWTFDFVLLCHSTVLESLRHRLRWIEYLTLALPASVHFTDGDIAQLRLLAFATIEMAFHYYSNSHLTAIVFTRNSANLQ